MFVIVAELHAKPQGRFQTQQLAVLELPRRAAIPWSGEPNRAPCTNWLNCRRPYELVHYVELSRNLTPLPGGRRSAVTRVH
jgi:hypothetical protein